MNIDIQVKGLDELIKKLGKATAQSTIETPLEQGAYFLQAWSQKNRFIGGGGKGRSKFGGDVQPNILTSRSGVLRGSIAVSRSIRREVFEFFIGTNVKYAKQHELGLTINKVSSKGKSFSVKYPKRPFLRPAIENQDNINRITKSINKSIQDALSK